MDTKSSSVSDKNRHSRTGPPVFSFFFFFSLRDALEPGAASASAKTKVAAEDFETNAATVDSASFKRARKTHHILFFSVGQKEVGQ